MSGVGMLQTSAGTSGQVVSRGESRRSVSNPRGKMCSEMFCVKVLVTMKELPKGAPAGCASGASNSLHQVPLGSRLVGVPMTLTKPDGWRL